MSHRVEIVGLENGEENNFLPLTTTIFCPINCAKYDERNSSKI